MEKELEAVGVPPPPPPPAAPATVGVAEGERVERSAREGVGARGVLVGASKEVGVKRAVGAPAVVALGLPPMGVSVGARAVGVAPALGEALPPLASAGEGVSSSTGEGVGVCVAATAEGVAVAVAASAGLGVAASQAVAEGCRAVALAEAVGPAGVTLSVLPACSEEEGEALAGGVGVAGAVAVGRRGEADTEVERVAVRWAVAVPPCRPPLSRPPGENVAAARGEPVAAAAVALGVRVRPLLPVGAGRVAEGEAVLPHPAEGVGRGLEGVDWALGEGVESVGGEGVGRAGEGVAAVGGEGVAPSLEEGVAVARWLEGVREAQGEGEGLPSCGVGVVEAEAAAGVEVGRPGVALSVPPPPPPPPPPSPPLPAEALGERVVVVLPEERRGPEGLGEAEG